MSKDISERFRVRNDEALRALLRLLINSTQYSISKMYNTMKSMGYVVGKTSLANYIGYIESSYFLIYENAVALEFLRRSGHDTETFYWKDMFGKEVDFVVRRYEGDYK
ncbi:DUF4143 domain-containing protein [Methanocella conradii]|uniref:DUF4143 domain-containing protein n=1 Tax=Methanocella conradii TaxID=1175444 RepID=UPI0024B36B0A|nr:DUF4143 domain-containing protein [Methanocella conradii]MDI6895988.1 DUF4143 domain-containing protein [Methanocella conradii]